MIVVDTNLIVYLHLHSEQTELAEKVFVVDPYWVAPFLWRSEFNNVLALYIRKHIFTLNEAVQTAKIVQDFMQGKEHHVPSPQILNLVSISSCSAYDCEFVALAQRLDVPLVTTDKQILTAFSSIAQSPKVFAN